MEKTLHESKLAHDHDKAFKVRTRGVKMAGLWAAERLGLSGSAAEEYARSVVATDFDEAGDEDVIRRLKTELADAGVTEADIRAALTRCLTEAEMAAS